MNREDLARWLAMPRRTWRWSRQDVARYDAVEVTPVELRWFRWSHEPEDGGMMDEHVQTVAVFHASGPPPEMAPPATVLADLRRWLDEHCG